MKVISQSLYIALFLLGLFSACSKEKTLPNATENTATEISNLVNLSAREIQTLALQTGVLAEKNLAATFKINGTVQTLAQSKAFVSTQMQGLVHSIAVKLGQSVSQGQVIAYVSSKEFIDLQENYLRLRSIAQLGASDTMALLANDQYRALQENFKTLMPQIEYAEKEVQRQLTLVAGNAGSAKQLELAKKEFATLQNTKETLQAQMKLIAQHSRENIFIQEQSLANQLSILGIEAKNLTSANMQRLLPLRAPISGKISNLQVRIGEAVDMQAPVAEIISTKDLYLTLRVYEHQLPFFMQGQKIKFFVSPYESEVFEAEVTEMGVSFDMKDKSTLIQARILSNNSRLMEGLPVVAIIQNVSQKYWTVPKDAIAHTEGKDYIFVVEKKSAESMTLAQIYVEKLLTTETEIGIHIPQLEAIKNKEIALNKAFFILGKMTNKGDEE